jgi:hypothetical protein
MLEWTGGKDAPWSVIYDLHFQDEVTQITVPAGFETDLASVPRLLWGLIPPYGRYIRAAIIHDYLYATGKIDRERADGIFLALMRQDKVEKWKQIIMYLAVRGFGWRNFHKRKGI